MAVEGSEPVCLDIVRTRAHVDCKRAAMPAANRSEKLDLRIAPEDKQILRTAASASGQTLAQFVLESAIARAQETLPDRRAFGLDAEGWEAFIAALEASPRPLPRVERLLKEPSVFE